MLCRGRHKLHLIRNTFKYASKKYWGQIAADLKPIYRAPTREAAWAAFEEFEEKWAKPYPAIGQLCRNAWEQFVPFLDHDVEIRTVLCSTNALVGVPERPLPTRGHRPGPLPDRAGRPEVPVSGDQVTGPQGNRSATMDHALEASAQRVRDHLR
jgi:hypothetical protein